jgi:hypothetical protein
VAGGVVDLEVIEGQVEKGQQPLIAGPGGGSAGIQGYVQARLVEEGAQRGQEIGLGQRFPT